MIHLLLALLLAVAPAEPGPVGFYGNWAVGCDNGLVCEAFSVDPTDEIGTQPAAIVVQRGPGEHGGLHVMLRALDTLPGDRIGLVIDGEHLGWTEGEAGEEFHFTDARAMTLARAIANGSEAYLQGADGTELGPMSLDGSYAALLFIDDQQSRDGTVTALTEVGDAPAARVAAPPTIPRIAAPAPPNVSTADPISAQRAKAIRDAHECFEDGDNPRRNEAIALEPDLRLILISCGGGAYNFNDFVYLARGDTLTPATFDAEVGWGDEGPPMLVNAWWDEDSGTLNEYAKGRGIGDCGTAQSFVWDGETFRLVERRTMPDCRGSAHWITNYRANVVRDQRR